MKIVKIILLTTWTIAFYGFVGYTLYGYFTQPVGSISLVQVIPPTVNETPKLTPPTVDELLRLVNEERAKVGVAPLTIDTRLNQSAQFKADDMFTNIYFNHVDSSGKHGYSYVYDYAPGLCSIASENITDNTTIESNTSKQAIYNWVNSEPHYKAMINPNYTLTGFGVSGTKIVEHFCQT